MSLRKKKIKMLSKELKLKLNLPMKLFQFSIMVISFKNKELISFRMMYSIKLNYQTSVKPESVTQKFYKSVLKLLP